MDNNDSDDNNSVSSYDNVEIVTPEMIAEFATQTLTDTNSMNLMDIPMFTEQEASAAPAAEAEVGAEAGVRAEASDVELQRELIIMITSALHIYLSELMDMVSPQMFMTNLFTSLMSRK